MGRVEVDFEFWSFDMRENLYSPEQKTLSRQGKDNWDRIFHKPAAFDRGEKSSIESGKERK